MCFKAFLLSDKYEFCIRGVYNFSKFYILNGHFQRATRWRWRAGPAVDDVWGLTHVHNHTPVKLISMDSRVYYDGSALLLCPTIYDHSSHVAGSDSFY